MEKNPTIKQMCKTMKGSQNMDQLHRIAGLVTKVSTELCKLCSDSLVSDSHMTSPTTAS